MSAFKSRRIAHEFTQTNSAPPEKVFPLLCPVLEAEWIPGWQYQLIYSDSGVAELGCIFTTPNPTVDLKQYSSRADSAANTPMDTTWICTEYDPAAFRVAYVWIKPGRVATELSIRLTGGDDGNARSHIWFRYTGLSREGNAEVEGYDRKWFESKMKGWETAINHYLSTGKMIAA